MYQATVCNNVHTSTMQHVHVTIIAVYAPEEGKLRESEDFYEVLQQIMNTTDNSDQVILMGDLNARVGNRPIPNIIGTFGEQTCNVNGNLLRDFATYNRLKITNTFFRKKDIHKYTWTELQIINRLCYHK